MWFILTSSWNRVLLNTWWWVDAPEGACQILLVYSFRSSVLLAAGYLSPCPLALLLGDAPALPGSLWATSALLQ